MKFVGGLLKFIGILLALGGTALCVVMFMELPGLANYIMTAFIWACVILVTIICWALGSVLTNFQKLEKRTEQLEKKYEALLLAQASAYHMAPTPATINNIDTETQIEGKPAAESTGNTIPLATPNGLAAATPIVESVPDSPKKKSKTGLLIGSIGGVCVLCVIAFFVLKGQPESEDTSTKPDPITTQQPASDDDSEETKKLYAEMVPNEIQGVWADANVEGLISLYAFRDDRVETYVVNIGEGAASVMSGTYSVEDGKVKYHFSNGTGYSYFTYDDNTLRLFNANNAEFFRMSAADIWGFLEQEEKNANNNGVIVLADLIINYFADSTECSVAIEKKEAINDAIEEQGLAALAQLRTEYDKVQKLTWYESKSQPEYTDICCYIYPYIGRMDDGHTWLRVKLNYTDAKTDRSWIFFEKVIFSVDGTNTTKTFNRSELVRDNDTEVWETADFEPDAAEIKLLRDIANSAETIIRFQGDEYHEDHIVTPEEKAAIVDILTAFEYLKK